VAVSGLSGVTAIAAGDDYSLAVLKNGIVMAWGKNNFGQLGDGTSTGPDRCAGSACSTTPVPVRGLRGVAAIAAGSGSEHSLALLSDGQVMAWGLDNEGQLGIGTSTSPRGCGGNCSTTPLAASELDGVTAIAVGEFHSLALLSNGTVMAWGGDVYGQLGDGDLERRECEAPCSRTPVAVSGLSGVKAIAAGVRHSLALLQNGTLMAWGDNADGELGDGTSSGPSDCFSTLPCSTLPVPVSGLSGVTAIAAGGFESNYESQSLALLADGTVEAWGGNAYNELGAGPSGGPNYCSHNSNLPCSTTPVRIKGLSGVTAITAGGAFSLATRKAS
jgi:alpha-tubulin suppressor-like RCC1 family protein